MAADDKLKKVLSALTGGLGSVPGLTLLILIAIDLLLRQGNPVDAIGYNSVDTWSLPPKYEMCRKSSPDVALIGSSLLMVLSQTEGEAFLSWKVSPPYLQSQLSKITGQAITCLNMCSGMQMISEGYMIVRSLANQADHPPVVFLGTAMRDFTYWPLKDEWGTGTFISSAPFAPVDQETLSLMSCSAARGAFLLSHYWYLFRNRTDFAHIGSAVCKNFLERLPLDQSFDRITYFYDFRPSKDGYLWEEWVPRKHGEPIWKRNPELMKYLVRTEHEKTLGDEAARTMSLEKNYFEAMCNFCRLKGIQLVVINMPLSPEITGMSPPDSEEHFRDYLHDSAQKYQAKYIDLSGDPEFPSQAFLDGAHLKYAYAVKLADRITHELQVHYPDVLSAMRNHALVRAREQEK